MGQDNVEQFGSPSTDRKVSNESSSSDTDPFLEGCRRAGMNHGHLQDSFSLGLPLCAFQGPFPQGDIPDYTGHWAHREDGRQ